MVFTDHCGNNTLHQRSFIHSFIPSINSRACRLGKIIRKLKDKKTDAYVP